MGACTGGLGRIANTPRSIEVHVQLPYVLNSEASDFCRAKMPCVLASLLFGKLQRIVSEVTGRV